MAAQHRELPRYGVQFHPESILTPEGPGIVRSFLELAHAGTSASGARTPTRRAPSRRSCCLPRTRIAGVRTRPAVQPIVPAVAEQLVRVRPTEQEVGPGAPAEHVVAPEAVQGVGLPVAAQDVVARAADEPSTPTRVSVPSPVVCPVPRFARILPEAKSYRAKSNPPRPSIASSPPRPRNSFCCPLPTSVSANPLPAAPSTPSSVALIPGATAVPAPRSTVPPPVASSSETKSNPAPADHGVVPGGEHDQVAPPSPQ